MSTTSSQAIAVNQSFFDQEDQMALLPFTAINPSFISPLSSCHQSLKAFSGITTPSSSSSSSSLAIISEATPNLTETLLASTPYRSSSIINNNPWASWEQGRECLMRSKRRSGDGDDNDDEHHHHELGVSVMKMKRSSMKGRRKVREPRFCFKTMSDVDVLDDGYKWRKYGQKVVKNTHHPRSYYRCTQDNCRVKKRVERLAEDPRMVITTYEGRHAHSPSNDLEDLPQTQSHITNFFW